MTVADNIRRLSPAMKLIIANVIVYFAMCIASLLRIDESLTEALVLPSSFLIASYKPWTIISYSFVHANLWHLIANMLWLYCFGAIFLEIFSTRRFITVYVVGAIAGALSYLAAALVAPASVLAGSSAAVMAVAAATVTAKPDYCVNLWLFGRVKIKWVALFYIAFALLTTELSLAAVCPHAAHLGGILTGVTAALWCRLPRHQRKPRPRRIVTQPLYTPVQLEEQRLDALLDKVRVSGYASLSEADKAELIDLSKKIKK